MNRHLCFGACMALVSSVAVAGDRQIGVDPMLSVTWSTLTGGATTPPPTVGNNMQAGFWQRSSGARPGVGSINTGVVEFQLPENAPQRIRSATLEFRARAVQCAGAEPVVFEVFGYPGNGKADHADSMSGVRLARMSADCKDNPAFTQPIDVTNLVRQLSVPSGLRFAGINVRKMNNRALPSLFGFSAAKLTIVVADQDLAISPTSGPVAGAGADGTQQNDPGNLLGRLAGAAATVIAGGGSKPSQKEGREQAAAAIKDAANAAPAGPAADAGAPPAAGGVTPGVAASTAPATGIASTAGAAASSVPAASAATVNVDIVGLKLGMSLAEIKRGLHAHSPEMKLDETRGIVNNVAATEYLSWVIARAAQRAPEGSADAIGVHFPPPPNAHRAMFIERFTSFQRDAYPLFVTLEAALVKKFGAPSFKSEGMILWTWNVAGVQIVENSVAARCGKFAPIDPPARGQNVLFNGYKTAGCGVTVYARYERGTGPSNRDLVRWLSISMIDDTRFEDMRQAAARFATQATRETASKVAAPKL